MSYISRNKLKTLTKSYQIEPNETLFTVVDRFDTCTYIVSHHCLVQSLMIGSNDLNNFKVAFDLTRLIAVEDLTSQHYTLFIGKISLSLSYFSCFIRLFFVRVFCVKWNK